MLIYNDCAYQDKSSASLFLDPNLLLCSCITRVTLNKLKLKTKQTKFCVLN